MPARWFFQQIMIAVDYCHRKGVTNRAIKLENILLQVRALYKLCPCLLMPWKPPVPSAIVLGFIQCSICIAWPVAAYYETV